MSALKPSNRNVWERKHGPSRDAVWNLHYGRNLFATKVFVSLFSFSRINANVIYIRKDLTFSSWKKKSLLHFGWLRPVLKIFFPNTCKPMSFKLSVHHRSGAAMTLWADDKIFLSVFCHISYEISVHNIAFVYLIQKAFILDILHIHPKCYSTLSNPFNFANLLRRLKWMSYQFIYFILDVYRYMTSI